MEVKCLEVKMVPIGELKPHPDNANDHPEDQIVRLAKIIEYQGWRAPIKVSNRSGFITAGHGRLLAAQLNKYTEVPVSFQDYTDDDQELADVHADNAIALWAELDLGKINTQLEKFDPNFDLEMLGLKNFTLDAFDKFDHGDEDAVPEAPVVPVVKRGELWILGEHRLLIDDCTVKENVERLMGGEKADMVFTDPPYIGMVGADWDKTDLDWPVVFGCLALATADECNIVITGQTPIIFKWFPLLSERFRFVQDLVWVKQRAVNLSQTTFARRHENILWFTKGDKYFDSELSRTQTDTKRTNKWSNSKIVKGSKGGLRGGEEEVMGFTAQSVLEFGRVYHHHEEYEGHPTQKPTELIVYLAESLSKQGCNVLDVFLGSGSTLIACEKSKRRCYGLELLPEYGQVIIQRWEKFSGKTAHREDGKTLAELKVS